MSSDVECTMHTKGICGASPIHMFMNENGMITYVPSVSVSSATTVSFRQYLALQGVNPPRQFNCGEWWSANLVFAWATTRQPVRFCRMAASSVMCFGSRAFKARVS